MLKNIFNYKLLLVIIALTIIFIRIPALTSRTIHIDEGWGIRGSEAVLSGDWQYSPENGHGSTFYYLGAVIRTFSGTNIAIFRTFTTILMLLSLLILWLICRRELGKIGEIILLAGLGLSSGMLFFSTYFIHEMLFILLTVVAFVSIELWLKTERGFWLPIFIVSASLMYMTKETAIFTYASWFVAVILIMIWKNNFKDILKKLVSLENIVFMALGLILTVVLYFFFFGKSLDLFRAPFLWLTERGLKMHLRPWYYFITLLFLHESMFLILGGLSALFITLKKMWNPKILFFFLWFLLILIIYSSIPYKTPWLIPNIILPLALFVAFGVSTIWKKTGNNQLLISIVIVLIIISFTSLLSDNFLHPDREEKYDYTYLQAGKSYRNFLAIIDQISNLDKSTPLQIQIIGDKNEAPLYVVTEKYNRIYEPFVPGLPVYINWWHSAEDTKKILSQNGDDYVFLKFTYYTNGPDVDLFVRQDKWEEYKSTSGFITPTTIWADGTLRYD